MEGWRKKKPNETKLQTLSDHTNERIGGKQREIAKPPNPFSGAREVPVRRSVFRNPHLIGHAELSLTAQRRKNAETISASHIPVIPPS